MEFSYQSTVETHENEDCSLEVIGKPSTENLSVGADDNNNDNMKDNQTEFFMTTPTLKNNLNSLISSPLMKIYTKIMLLSSIYQSLGQMKITLTQFLNKTPVSRTIM